MAKKKIIELEESVFKKLSIQAAFNGKNLKAYIQDCLIKISEKKVRQS